MNLYRITGKKRTYKNGKDGAIDKQSILSGKGAEIIGGRWNLPGTPALYCATEDLIAYMEHLSHLLDNGVPGYLLDYCLIVFEVEGRDIPKLPIRDTFEEPFEYERHQELGSTYLEDPYCLGFSIPSVAAKVSPYSPYRTNVVLNPKAKKLASRVKILDVLDLQLHNGLTSFYR